jgi:uncharacterized small protein (DUF1192 family)
MRAAVQRGGLTMMEDSDLEPRMRPPAKKNLEALSVTELQAYIDELGAEIERTRAEIASRQRQRSGAEALFKR